MFDLIGPFVFGLLGSLQWRVSHHWKTVPIDTAVAETRKTCGARSS